MSFGSRRKSDVERALKLLEGAIEIGVAPIPKARR